MATASDAEEIAEIYRHYVLTSPASFETVPPDSTEFRHRIERVMATYPWLVLETAGRIEGYAYASAHRDRAAYQWAADVSAYVRSDCRRRGIGRRLYTELLGIVRQQGCFTACAGITMPNDASVGLHQAMGFELVGVYQRVGFKIGAWHDTSWWQLELREREENPTPPVSWRELDDFSDHILVARREDRN